MAVILTEMTAMKQDYCVNPYGMAVNDNQRQCRMTVSSMASLSLTSASFKKGAEGQVSKPVNSDHGHHPLFSPGIDPGFRAGFGLAQTPIVVVRNVSGRFRVGG